MATSNFLPFNPAQTNQETDAQYLTDALRTGGIALDDILPSPFLNKIWYQSAMMCAALGQMMAGKGYTISDANLSTLAATLANILTTADVRPGLLQVPYNSSVTFDCLKANGFQVTLTGNLNVSVINISPGQQVVLAFYQANAGGFSVALPSNVRSPGTVDPGAGNTSLQVFYGLADGTLYPLSGMVVVG